MKKIAYISFFIASVCLSSCNNELDVLTEYKETMVVFGLLNPADSVQYIKINKAFLGEEDALVMGGIFDSSNYVEDELSVTMQRILNGSPAGATIVLVKDTMIPKPPGVFPSPLQFLYKTSVPILQDGSEYKLTITNSSSGLTVDAKTPIVQNIPITNPVSNLIIGLVSATPFKVKWTSTPSGRLYDVILRFNYKETYVWDSTQVAYKSVDMHLGQERSNDLAGGQVMTNTIDSESNYRFIGNSISPDPNVVRSFVDLEFIFTAAAEDFTTYMDVAQTATSSFQALQAYSNVNGGVGLFSSRFTKTVTGVQLNTVSLDTLADGQFTYNLGF